MEIALLERSGWVKMAFESGGIPEDWKTFVIVSFYKSEVERAKSKNYGGIIKIHAGVLVDRLHKVTEGLMR